MTYDLRDLENPPSDAPKILAAVFVGLGVALLFVGALVMMDHPRPQQAVAGAEEARADRNAITNVLAYALAKSGAPVREFDVERIELTIDGLYVVGGTLRGLPDPLAKRQWVFASSLEHVCSEPAPKCWRVLTVSVQRPGGALTIYRATGGAGL